MNRTAMLPGCALAAALAGATVGWWLATSSTTPRDGDAARGDDREVLYWVAPMDPDYRRDEPGKSPMGMDLVPVYAGSARSAGDGQPSLRIEPAVINNIGVKTAPAARGTLHRQVRTVGFITPDEERLEHIHVRTEGWIEELAVGTGGARVDAGQLLFRIYSPALVSAQEEYLQSQRAGRPALVRAGGTRLRALGMSGQQIEALATRGEVRQLAEVRAPIAGYLMELNVRQGMFVEPGTIIMSLADLSAVWVDVDVFEHQINWVATGQKARMTLPFAPGRDWAGKVEYIYPTIRPQTRTARVRLAFANPDLALKPNMYASVVIEGAPRRDVVHVPAEAVIRTGEQERVILALGGGRFRPAQVRAGLESGGRLEIREGLRAGEKVVVSSQFLIDSEASMDAALLRLLDPAEDPGEGSAMDHAGHAMSAGEPAVEQGSSPGHERHGEGAPNRDPEDSP